MIKRGDDFLSEILDQEIHAFGHEFHDDTEMGHGLEPSFPVLLGGEKLLNLGEDLVHVTALHVILQIFVGSVERGRFLVFHSKKNR